MSIHDICEGKYVGSHSYEEISTRWKAILFDEVLSTYICARISAMPLAIRNSIVLDIISPSHCNNAKLKKYSHGDAEDTEPEEELDMQTDVTNSKHTIATRIAIQGQNRAQKRFNSTFNKVKENESNYLAMLVDSSTGVRFPMGRVLVLVGNDPEDDTGILDINLHSSPGGWRLNKIQACIKLERNGEFYIKNLGDRVICVDSWPMHSQDTRHIGHGAVLQLSMEAIHTFEVNAGIQALLKSELTASVLHKRKAQEIKVKKQKQAKVEEAIQN